MIYEKTTNPFLEKAIYYKVKFGLDFITLKITKAGKKPAIKKWKHLQDSIQTIEDLEKFNWNGVNGIGMINKILATLDFDKCKDVNFIRTIAHDLGGNYWIVKTGKGFHLHIIIDDIENLTKILGKKGIYTLESKNNLIVKQVEIRAYGCYSTFSHSKHYNGSDYTFIDGEPKKLPDKICTQKLLEVLEKHFYIEAEKKAMTNPKGNCDFITELMNGVGEGNRHKRLTKIFGKFYAQGMDKEHITAILSNWNKLNEPPITEKEFQAQVNDLFKRYSKGLDGIFYEFNNCLLQLQDEDRVKLKKIVCFSVVEFGSDDNIIKELQLEEELNGYHQECKELVEHYESITGKKDQIVRVGKTMIIDVLNKKIRFDYFCLYVGIISYLGRNTKKPAKQISLSIISYRAIGFKNESEYLFLVTILKPISINITRAGVDWLVKANFIRTFTLKKGQMRWYSTFFSTEENLAEWVSSRTIKKINNEIGKVKLRLRVVDDIKIKENELKQLKRTNSLIETNTSSLHLLSNEN